jgi:hypothetical protein
MEAPMQVGPYKVPGGVIVWPMVYALHNRCGGVVGGWGLGWWWGPAIGCFVLLLLKYYSMVHMQRLLGPGMLGGLCSS